MKINNLFSVEGKIALVTGGSRGIGEMIAAGYLANGAKVYISSRKAEACDATAQRLMSEYGGECISIPSDLSGLPGIDHLVAEISKNEDKLDILVNNAGVSWGAPLAEFPEIGWDKVMDTNVKGVFFLTQQCLPLLEAAGTPENPSRVINIGSIDGIQAPAFETYSYGPSKAAVHAMTRQLGAKLAPRNIIVNAIAPGPFPTWMLSTGVGTGGGRQADSRRSRGFSGRHCWPRHLPELSGRCLHGRRSDHLRRRRRRLLERHPDGARPSRSSRHRHRRRRRHRTRHRADAG
jgi:NAD(P)-dependent dehydrogenase (short-subunit alcohol dehydrogenase family)